MSQTKQLFDQFLALPLDKPCLCKMHSENKLTRTRSALYKIKKQYEKETNSSVCMILSKVIIDNEVFLELTRSDTEIQLFTQEDGKLIQVDPKTFMPIATTSQGEENVSHE